MCLAEKDYSGLHFALVGAMVRWEWTAVVPSQWKWKTGESGKLLKPT
jgi:hypothetical protein